MDRQSPAQDSLMREGSSPPSPTSPVFFAPFRNRSRIITEETIWMQNKTTYQHPSMEMTDANPFTSQEAECEDEQDDDRSAVSSLSNDSRRRMGPGWDSNETEPKGPPPNEIDISVLIKTEVPDWLKDTESRSSSATDNPPPPPPPPDLTPILTGGVSPTNIRPSMGRNHRSNLNPTPFSTPDMRKLPRPTSISRVLTMGSTITGGTSTISKGSGTFVSSQEDVSILGNRPRRHHHRNPSTALSVGSVVGQSSFVTAPSAALTATSGSFSDQSQSFQHQKNAQRVLDHLVAEVTTPTAMAMHNRRNPVKEDMKYIWGRVSIPIRRLAGTDGEVILQRASGCLT
jgi:hypothetical protein